ncbi:probable serine/threonine-protein kinase yakA isoform X2 [Tigriopus californicus]|uniref:probable serine/threonine-protein kinase yakA isoform X2 n=1 Tax=Tigriopus californicus TaxID=6832 RepID=UPI0027D9E037|nr:probable serine/threonine-protein kinase yakA isoform X2 [Tigriopus californicus]
MESFPNRRHLSTNPNSNSRFNRDSSERTLQVSNGNSPGPSSNNSSPSSTTRELIMPSISSARQNGTSRIPSVSRHQPFASALSSMDGSKPNSNINDLRNTMAEMQNMNTMSTASSSSSQHITTQRRSEFNRSMSSGVTGLMMPSPAGFAHTYHHPMKRHETSPAIIELPNQSPTEDSLLGEENGAGRPIVTSPVSEMAELSSDPESNSGGLTSPNLVSSTGLPLVQSLVGVNTVAGLSSKFNLALPGVGNGASLSLSSNGNNNNNNNSSSSSSNTNNSNSVGVPGSGGFVSHEERKTSTSSKTHIVTGQSKTEKATANSSQVVRLQRNDLSYEENSAQSATTASMETADGTIATQASGSKHMSKKMTSEDLNFHHSSSASMSGAKLSSKNFGTIENMSSASSQRSSFSRGGTYLHQSSHQSASSKRISLTRSPSILSTNQIASLMNSTMTMEEIEQGLMRFDDLEQLTPNSNMKNVETTLVKYCGLMCIQKSGTLELIEPFVQTHTPKAFAQVSATHSHGQSPNWLKRLLPVLTSHKEEARNLAAFHFCMEAEIKKQQGNTKLFKEIDAIESLKKVASSPNGIASKYAAQTLRLIGEEVPHKLSQQVPTWSVEDVREWVKQIGFPQYADSFTESRVDGDLLLQLSEEMLKEDIQMRNGILRRRFLRELTNLKRVADYSSCDPSNLNEFLQSLGQEYCVYTYDMINAGIDRDTLLNINDEQLLSECGIKNKIHRLKIQQGVKIERGEFSITDDSSIDKNLDVFISYRRSNGSQLASLLKVHLEIRNYSVFIDVDRLEAGKFDNNLLQSIRSAKNFVLVLTPGAFDRCVNDVEQHDWIHKEIACALQSQCNIIPVFDNFIMPEQAHLPETMRAVTAYNGIKWIHDYQEACVDKIDRFIRGDNSYMMDRFLNSQATTASGYGGSNSTYNRQNTYQRTPSNDNSTCSDELVNSSATPQ